MECCSLLWTGAPASHLDYVESKDLKIIGISHDEARAQALLFWSGRLVGGLSLSLSAFQLFSHIAPSALSVSGTPQHLKEAHVLPVNPLLVKFPKSRLTAPVNSFIPHFSCLWNHLPETVLSHPSLQDLSHPQFCPMIFITPLTFINPTILLLLCFLPSSLSSFPVRSFP